MREAENGALIWNKPKALLKKFVPPYPRLEENWNACKMMLAVLLTKLLGKKVFFLETSKV